MSGAELWPLPHRSSFGRCGIRYLWKWTGIIDSSSCNVMIFLVPRIKVFLCFWYKYIYSIIKCLTNLFGSAHWLVFFFSFLINDLVIGRFFFSLSLFLSGACSQFSSSYQMDRIEQNKSLISQKWYLTNHFLLRLHFCLWLVYDKADKWLWLSFCLL